MKALSISACIECRHYEEIPVDGHVSEMYCNAAKSYIASFEPDIPVWCPLPEMPETE